MLITPILEILRNFSYIFQNKTYAMEEESIYLFFEPYLSY